MKRLKILLISDAWKPQINGVVRTLEKTADGLNKLGHQVLIVGPDQFPTIPCPSYPSIRLAIRCRAKLAKLSRVFAPDRIHIATEGPLGLAARRYCIRNHYHFTTSLHTLFAEYVNLRWNIPESWGYRYLRWFHDPAVATMVATSSMEKMLVEKGFKHLERWSRGVDTRLFKPGSKDFLSDKRPIFLYVGRVAVEKNLDSFLSLDLPGSKYVVGDGPALDGFRRQYPDTRFVGFKQGEPLAAHIRSADVVVFPSLTDTFGLTVLESLACGVPVAAFPVQGPKDILTEPNTGCLDWNLLKATLKALNGNSTHCRELAMQYSWEASTAQFLNHLTPSLFNAQQSRQTCDTQSNSSRMQSFLNAIRNRN